MVFSMDLDRGRNIYILRIDMIKIIFPMKAADI